MTLDPSLRTTFDNVADLYHQVRPEYPTPLIEDVLSLSGILPAGRILEIGCGPGTATLPFAQRGYRMLCIELGTNLAQLAAENCQPYPQVKVQNVSFEQWPLQHKAFDLVICAEAFHWITPDVRFVKTAAALKDNGSIALFWNGHHRGLSDFFPAIEVLYRETVPQLLAQRQQSRKELEEKTVRDIKNSNLFDIVAVRHYRWQAQYTANAYTKLLNTYSPVQNLARAVQQDLLDQVHRLIQQHGGRVETEYQSQLYVAKVRSTHEPIS